MVLKGKLAPGVIHGKDITLVVDDGNKCRKRVQDMTGLHIS